MTTHTVAAAGAGLPAISILMNPVDLDVEEHLEALNVEYDRAFRVYRKSSDLTDGEDASDPIVASYSLAMTHAIRQMREIRNLAMYCVPTTVRGFALKARLLTDTETSEWTNVDVHLMNALIGQLLSAAGLAPICRPDNAAQEIFDDAVAGKPFFTKEDAARYAEREGK